VKLILKNQLTAGGAFDLLHLLHHLNGVAFGDVDIKAVLNSQITSSSIWIGKPLAIHAHYFSIKGIDNLWQLEEKRHFVKSEVIACQLSNSNSVDDQLLRLLAKGSQYCYIGIRFYFHEDPDTSVVINKVVDFFERDVKSLKAVIPSVVFSMYPGDLASEEWPSLCPIERGVQTEGEKEWKFNIANRHSGEKFEVTIKDTMRTANRHYRSLYLKFK